MLIGGVRWPLCTGALPVGSWEFMCGTDQMFVLPRETKGLCTLKKSLTLWKSLQCRKTAKVLNIVINCPKKGDLRYHFEASVMK